MKKFEFSLNKLSDYKGQILKKEKNILAALRNEQQSYIDQKMKLINDLEKTNEDFNRASDFTAHNMAIHKYFCSSLSDQIKEQIDLIAKTQTKINQQMLVVISATKEVNTLDKLYEKQYDEYKKAEQKENELFIEEFVSNASVRKH